MWEISFPLTPFFLLPHLTPSLNEVLGKKVEKWLRVCCIILEVLLRKEVKSRYCISQLQQSLGRWKWCHSLSLWGSHINLHALSPLETLGERFTASLFLQLQCYRVCFSISLGLWYRFWLKCKTFLIPWSSWGSKTCSHTEKWSISCHISK